MQRLSRSKKVKIPAISLRCDYVKTDEFLVDFFLTTVGRITFSGGNAQECHCPISGHVA
jgi:hypothetical protein